MIVAGFGLSHYFFNRGNIGLSVPLAYPPLLYLLARALWLGFRRKPGSGLRPTMPIAVLAVMTVVLIAGRITLNVVDSNVIDVGYSGVIGADRIADRKPIYDNFPSDDQSGDTYGPVAYYAYVPFEQALPWSGTWDDLPAAHAASIFFDLATMAALFLLGRRLRRGRRGTELGHPARFAWAACPYTAYALESNTNDALVALGITATLLLPDLADRPRGHPGLIVDDQVRTAGPGAAVRDLRSDQTPTLARLARHGLARRYARVSSRSRSPSRSRSSPSASRPSRIPASPPSGIARSRSRAAATPRSASGARTIRSAGCRRSSRPRSSDWPCWSPSARAAATTSPSRRSAPP